MIFRLALIYKVCSFMKTLSKIRLHNDISYATCMYVCMYVFYLAESIKVTYHYKKYKNRHVWIQTEDNTGKYYNTYFHCGPLI